jgi:hypothetical protein
VVTGQWAVGSGAEGHDLKQEQQGLKPADQQEQE